MTHDHRPGHNSGRYAAVRGRCGAAGCVVGDMEGTEVNEPTAKARGLYPWRCELTVQTWKRFTDEQPDEAGWYWIRTDGYTGAWPHYVQVDADGAFIISGAGAFTPRMAAGLHWWPQRIEEPEGD